jgi:integrase
LDGVLPTRESIQKTEHHPALDYRNIPAFMAELRGRDSISARALEFLILCAARTGAVIGARWDEIDLRAKAWSVPSTRAGAKINVDQPRRIPLCDRAIELLKELPSEDGNAHLFIGARAGHGLSNAAMAELLKDMAWPSTTEGKLSTTHGMRSSFKDWCAETTNTPNFVSEAALWHATADRIEAAYRRGDLFEKRRVLMNTWMRYCGSPPVKTDKADEVVVPMRGLR